MCVQFAYIHYLNSVAALGIYDIVDVTDQSALYQQDHWIVKTVFLKLKQAVVVDKFLKIVMVWEYPA